MTPNVNNFFIFELLIMFFFKFSLDFESKYE